mgnify:CR=1 FL=1
MFEIGTVIFPNGRILLIWNGTVAALPEMGCGQAGADDEGRLLHAPLQSGQDIQDLGTLDRSFCIQSRSKDALVDVWFPAVQIKRNAV